MLGSILLGVRETFSLWFDDPFVVRQDSSSEDDEDDFGPSVVGKEKRVASVRYVSLVVFFTLAPALQVDKRRRKTQDWFLPGFGPHRAVSSLGFATGHAHQPASIVCVNQGGSKPSQATETAGAEACR